MRWFQSLDNRVGYYGFQQFVVLVSVSSAVSAGVFPGAQTWAELSVAGVQPLFLCVGRAQIHCFDVRIHFRGLYGGRTIGFARSHNKPGVAKLALCCSMVVNLSLLGVFKYADFAIGLSIP